MTGVPDGEDPLARLGEWLEGDEEVAALLTGLGASLLVTQRRVLIVRDKPGFRPGTGVQSWPHDSILGVTLSQPKRGQARIVVRTGPAPQDAVSMFLASERWADAERVIGEIRRRQKPGSRGR